MNRPRKRVPMAVLSVLAFVAPAADILAQAPTDGAAAKGVSRADAYYHFSMGHLYTELAGAYGNRGTYLSKAIDHLKLAIQADPSSSYLAERLSDAYVQAGRLNDAVTEAEDRLKKNPDAIEARRVLGRIYARLIGDTQNNRINEEMLRKATEQYQKIVAKEPGDFDSWLMLGRLHKVAQNSIESEKAFSRAIEIDPTSEEAMTGLAMVYSDLGDSKRAMEMLDRVARQNPNLRTLTTLANAHEQMRDYASAAQVLRQALEMAPENIELKRALAQNLLFSGQEDEALRLYQDIAAAEPKDAQTHLRVSQIYRQKRDFVKAREASERARQADPDNLEVRYNEVNLLEAEGRMEEAIAKMKELVDSGEKKSSSQAERGNRAVLLERLGLLYRSGEQYKQAVETFRKMEEINPESASRAAAQVMDTWRQAKEYSKAIEEADAAYKRFPKDRTILLIRASLLADMGRGDEAVSEVKKLLDGKSDREIYLALAQTYEKTKNYGEMGKALDAAEKLSMSSEDKQTVYFMRGAMYERAKNFDAAEAEFRKVLEVDPENASALNYLGYMLADRNVRLEEALRSIDKAVKLDPNNGAYLDSLGWVYYRLDRLDEAEKHLRRALERVSRDPTVRDHLGDVLAKKGQLKDAIGQWEISVKEWEASAPSEKDPAEIAKITKKLEGARIRLAKESSSTIAKPE
ncbi:MAG TPA: tetratricopeptide repeat protein [Bryobacteraceae bacterium]|nr:tetratricopeptide repeat protein [Bryobacteraceae bacterium]